MDISALQLEEIFGGILVILGAVYGVQKKLKSDGVISTHQKAEINIIETLTKQRDDCITLAERYRELLISAEVEIRGQRTKIDSLDNDNLKLLEKLSNAEAEIEILRQLLQYISDTVAIARTTIEEQ